MTTATISYAKSNLSALLRRVGGGEEVLILDRRRPVARLSRVETPTSDWDRRMADLARRGVVKLPSRRLAKGGVLGLKPLRLRRPVDVVAALIADREDRV
ncbi:MAG: hypothetical protein BWK77_05770 [Verrucomicrobia bacterium A1]|jgi:antitoxin (DNA-binding transcriptional repressor) of toxin-antitoxin stability system|nr:MAG: hypothetical protein BWK77_05770 [Verrucomicrobia bacterium A1]